MNMYEYLRTWRTLWDTLHAGSQVFKHTLDYGEDLAWEDWLFPISLCPDSVPHPSSCEIHGSSVYEALTDGINTQGQRAGNL